MIQILFLVGNPVSPILKMDKLFGLVIILTILPFIKQTVILYTANVVIKPFTNLVIHNSLHRVQYPIVPD